MGRKVKYTSWMQNGPNPNPGEFDTPNGTIDNGGGSPPASTPVTVPTTGSDYNGWNWEQMLVGVLGLTLPDRNDVTNQRWTAINFNSDGGSGLLRIFAATWRSVDAVGRIRTYSFTSTRTCSSRAASGTTFTISLPKRFRCGREATTPASSLIRGPSRSPRLRSRASSTFYQNSYHDPSRPVEHRAG